MSKNNNYDHDNILSRVSQAVNALEELTGRPEPSEGVPLPVARRQLYKLMLPHLYQIRQYAEFCRNFSKLEKLKAQGADEGVLQAALDGLDYEIPEYNCVTGLWGQPEARAAFEDISIEEHYNQYIAQGMDKKEAMKAVAKDRGVSKNEIYKKFIK